MLGVRVMVAVRVMVGVRAIVAVDVRVALGSGVDVDVAGGGSRVGVTAGAAAGGEHELRINNMMSKFMTRLGVICKCMSGF